MARELHIGGEEPDKLYGDTDFYEGFDGEDWEYWE
jgi:hypothetical protein